MATIIPLDGTLAVLKFTLIGDLDPMVITLGLEEAAGYNGTLCAEGIFDAATGTGAPFAAAAINSAYSFEGVTCYHQTAAGFVVDEHMDHVQGTSSGNPIPSNCALLIKKVTAFGGRRNRGRMYVPPLGFDDTNVDNHGNLNSVAALQSNWTAFYNALIAHAEIPPPVVYHDDGSAGTPITAFTVASQIATQRTRMR